MRGHPTHPPPQPRAVIRDWDRRAAEEFGIPGLLLMENAGGGAVRIIEDLALSGDSPLPEPFRIVCGPGNNGGDGFVLARHLHNRGFRVEVSIVGGARYRPRSDAGVNHEIVKRMGIPLVLEEGPPGPAASGRGTIIDAILGTGLTRPLEPPLLDWVRLINESGSPVVSLDIPSGLDADTGEPLGAAVLARHTITFGAAKLGFTRGSGPRHAGRVHIVDIGIPRAVWEGGTGSQVHGGGCR